MCSHRWSCSGSGSAAEGAHLPRVDWSQRQSKSGCAFEIGGRWSSETNTFVRLLAQARAGEEPPISRRRVEQAWRLRWGSLLACASAKAFAASLLDLRSGGVDGDVPPAHEVVNEFRHAGLTSEFRGTVLLL